MSIEGENSINVKVVFYMLTNLVLLVVTISCQVIQQSCPQKCGDVSVPYPFGITNRCALNEDFRLICNHSYNPPKLFLSKSSKYSITFISLDGYLRTSTPVARDCFDKRGAETQLVRGVGITHSNFFFSPTRNRFTVIGCDTLAILAGYSSVNEIPNASMAAAICFKESNVINGSCSGTGCSQNIIPPHIRFFNISLASTQNHTRVWSFNPCSYAFVTEAEYIFSKRDLQSFPNTVPTVIDWFVGDQSCEEATKNKSSYACKEHSKCYDYDYGPGYLCYCRPGFSGNPYVSGGCVEKL